MRQQKGNINVGELIVLSVLLIIAAFVLPWKNINWGRISTAPVEMVTVSGEAKTQQLNQIASFTAGVNAIKDNKEEAIKDVNDKMNALTEAIKTFGIPAADIKTQNLSIYQQQESYYDSGVQKMRSGQWNVNNSLEITLRDLTKATALAELLTKSGANNVYGPNFRFDDTSEAEKSLFAAAMEDAKSKAEIIAKASGRKLGKALVINEGASGSNLYPVYSLKDGMGGGGVPVEPGSGTVSKTVTVSFGLE